MKFTIESVFLTTTMDANVAFIRLLNTIAISETENDLWIGIENLKRQVALDDFFRFGFKNHYFWVYQRRFPRQIRCYPCRLLKAEFTD